jgi:hypothetical protein
MLTVIAMVFIWRSWGWKIALAFLLCECIVEAGLTGRLRKRKGRA